MYPKLSWHNSPRPIACELRMHNRHKSEPRPFVCCSKWHHVEHRWTAASQNCYSCQFADKWDERGYCDDNQCPSVRELAQKPLQFVSYVSQEFCIRRRKKMMKSDFFGGLFLSSHVLKGYVRMYFCEARLHSGRSVHFRPSLSPDLLFDFSEGLVPRLMRLLHSPVCKSSKQPQSL